MAGLSKFVVQTNDSWYLSSDKDFSTAIMVVVTTTFASLQKSPLAKFCTTKKTISEELDVVGVLA